MSKQDSHTDLSKPFILGNINVDPQNVQLSAGQQTLSCEPKVFELLLYFCAYPEQLRSRDELLNDLWHGRVVSDNAVNRKIYQLRKLLQTLDKSLEYIETVPKRGYRLVLSPSVTQATNENPLTIETAKPPPQTQTILNQWWLAPLLLIFVFLWANQIRFNNDKPTPTLIPITSIQGTEKYPALSPDNQKLVYSHSPDGNSHQLKQVNLHDNSEQNLTANTSGVHDINAQWHPNENKLAFIRLTPNGSCYVYQLSFNAQGTASTPQKIIECSSASRPNISWGVGEHQLFIAERTRKTLPYQLYSINTATGAKKQLTNDSNQGNTKGYYYIQRNDTGDKMVSLMYLSSNRVKVNTYNAEDFSKINSFELEAHIDGIAWQPNEEAFYFKRNQYIEKVNCEGKNREMIFHVGQDFSHLSFSTDSNKLVLSSKANTTNIYHYDINSQKTTHKVVNSTKQDKSPAMANQSSQMAFVSNRTGVNQFWKTDKNQQAKPMNVLPFDLGHSHFAWSPDDTQLLFEYQDQIHLFDVSTGHNFTIISDEHQAYHASWSYDGKSIIYSSNKTSDWQLWQLNIANNTHHQITQNGGYAGHNHSNGQLYFSKYHQDGLFRQNLDGSETQLLSDFSLLNWLNWQLKGDNIYFAKLWGNIAPENAGIYRYHIPSAQEHRIMPIQPRQLHDYTVAKDGSFIRYTRLEAQAGDILMLDLHPTN